MKEADWSTHWNLFNGSYSLGQRNSPVSSSIVMVGVGVRIGSTDTGGGVEGDTVEGTVGN